MPRRGQEGDRLRVEIRLGKTGHTGQLDFHRCGVDKWATYVNESRQYGRSKLMTGYFNTFTEQNLSYATHVTELVLSNHKLKAPHQEMRRGKCHEHGKCWKFQCWWSKVFVKLNEQSEYNEVQSTVLAKERRNLLANLLVTILLQSQTSLHMLHAVWNEQCCHIAGVISCVGLILSVSLTAPCMPTPLSLKRELAIVIDRLFVG